MPAFGYQNRILASLPKAAVSRLAPHLFHTVLEQGQTLLGAGQQVRYAYFLETGLASIVTTMKNGATVEVAVVGREGIVGLPALWDTGSMPNRTFIQISGSAFRVRASVLGNEFRRQGKLREKLQRYVQVHLIQSAQTAACNRLHEISKRLARWLLLCHDRIGSDHFEMTHQSFAYMLGAPRPSVTLAAGALQKSGLFDYSRGRVRILNRRRLELAACECYGVIRKECNRLGVL